MTRIQDPQILEVVSPSTLVDATNGSSKVGPNGPDASAKAGRSSRVGMEQLETRRIAAAKEAFSTRRVPKEAMRTLLPGAVRPRAGDIDPLAGHHISFIRSQENNYSCSINCCQVTR